MAGEVPDELLEATWQRLLGLFHERRDALFVALHELELTPPHGHALMTLRGGPIRMRDMADQMACDASYVTAVADRLEELGLAERRNAPDDRRVRELALTPKGRRVATRLHEIMHRPPDALRALPAADQAALARISEAIAPATHPKWLPPRTLR